jgi:hypothetical protein
MLITLSLPHFASTADKSFPSNGYLFVLSWVLHEFIQYDTLNFNIMKQIVFGTCSSNLVIKFQTQHITEQIEIEIYS